MIDGWYRIVGVSTLVPNIACEVRSPSAPSHGNTAGVCPPLWRHGWKWSETAIVSNPSSSASLA